MEEQVPWPGHTFPSDNGQGKDIQPVNNDCGKLWGSEQECGGARRHGGADGPLPGEAVTNEEDRFSDRLLTAETQCPEQ